jgi:predicted DNA-binding antitoxin AbrB/MazE fold protein
MVRFLLRSFALTGLLLGSTLAVSAQEKQSFSDVPPDHPAYQAVEYLKGKGIVTGYSDGTFKPEKKVNRAEGVKFLIAPLVTADQLKQATATVYNDIPANAWYMPYVEWARQAFHIIDGPPAKTSFYGEQPIIKVEFIKMLLIANKVDPNSYGEILLPLSIDVTNQNEWFYPYMRSAITSSITMATQEGELLPSKELTRGDVALFLFRFMMYNDGRRTQALLSEAETEILNILSFLEKNDITQAEYASARALLAARGAQAKRPDEALVQAAVKTTESFRSLVRAYRAGVNGDFDTVIELAGEAWNLADKAKQIHKGLESVAAQIQTIAKNMADSARELKAKGTTGQ